MNTFAEFLGPAIAAPAIVAAAVAVLIQMLPADTARRYAAAGALGLAFAVGYVLLPSWADLVPRRHWQWLPYLALAAALLGPVGRAEGVRPAERRLLHALLAIAAAWLLVPTWASLRPPRATCIALLAAYLFALMTLLEPLAGRVPGRLLTAALGLSAAGSAALVAAFVSLTYGQLGLLSACALLGILAAGLAGADLGDARTLVPGYALLAGGAAFVGAIEPSPPLPAPLPAAAAPLALWACELVPLPRSRAAAVVVRLAAVLATLAAAAAWTWRVS